MEGSQQQQDHHSSLKNIDEQRKKSKSQAEEYENKVGIINKILDQIKTGLACSFFYQTHMCIIDIYRTENKT